ncbi:PREDICTED: prospero homeobox protein 2 [Charadrius vociferus]|uniref:prospero homeobox protein 2 n=1 Tax=Charadrius vociferus TaxID=50402 RepID=UPI000521AE24|nr:PREDICTED: prospero homeobox protein 2 [Charadrius vociferus]
MPCAGDSDQLSDQHLRAKRARVESIIQGMNLSPTRLEFGTSLEAAFGQESERGNEMPRESKRKPRVPQQEQQLRWLQEKFSQVCNSGDVAQTQEGAEKAHPLPGKPGDSPDKDSATATSDLRKAPLWRNILEVHELEEDEDRGDKGDLPLAARVLSQALKHELAGVTSRVVDSVLKTIWPKAASHLPQQHHSLPLLGPEPQLDKASAGLSRATIQEALTPGHLKKAKLMFFFTRYPSSTLLKTYFLDVQFSRCITSQLIKWFSNFREFYYIQVEKFARQALLEGVVDAGALWVSRDSELFRALNTHYNKGNDFEVPGRFLEVASLTLREFFSAVRAGKDADPSWKKPIYKIISKLDSDIPEGFKATSCSQELLRS